jgi:predicted outer membrane repeat protein
LLLAPSIVEVNTAGDAGGGGYVWAHYPQGAPPPHVTIQGNRAARGGGFPAGGGALFNIHTCLVSGNLATDSGGGISVGGSVKIRQCTIVENQAGIDGSGVKRISGDIRLDNSIVWANYPSESQYSTGIVYTYSCLPGGTGTSISSDPQLANGFRLGPGSPCIDAGDEGKLPHDALDLKSNGNTTEPDPFDLDLLPRLVDDPSVPNTGKGVVDIGCYERP